MKPENFRTAGSWIIAALAGALLMCAGTAGCKSPAERRSTVAEDAKQTPWSVTYHDGSGNGFRFWQDRQQAPAQFAYTPVTPERSSSGSYSGGKPQTGTLTAEQVQELWRQLRDLEADSSLHVKGRQMRTGSLRVKDPAGERRLIIRNSPPLQQLNSFVEPFRGE